jgi:ATP-dependent DNA ligase
MDRQTGNGIINKCIQGTASKDEASRVFFSIWEAVPLKYFKEGKCNIDYDIRLDHAVQIIQNINDSNKFQLVKTKVVNTLKEAQELTNKVVAKGGEGGILKNILSHWKDHTSPNQVKMKARFETELRVVGWEYGDKGKKYEKKMGRVIFETDDGKIKVYVGTGFSDEQREENWNENIGRIGELEYESLSKSKTRKSEDPEYTLYGPAAFICWRDEKRKTDTLEDLLYR